MKKYLFWTLCTLMPLAAACSDDAKEPPQNNGNTNGNNTDENGNGNNTDENGNGNGSDTSDDPCKAVRCDEGICDEGVCVTDAMKAVKAETPCDSEIFAEFCVKETTYYCDRGAQIVIIGQCDEACVMYDDTTSSRILRRSGCVDGGSCSEPDAIRTECVDTPQGSQVFVSACQRTTRGTLAWISVDGYVCQGQCNAEHSACALEENECDPYRYQASCDRNMLSTCFVNSSLKGHIRQEYCDASCTTFHGKAACGMETCAEPGTRKSLCAPFDSENDYDAIDTICAADDQGTLYQVRTGQHTYCADGCDQTRGTCQ